MKKIAALLSALLAGCYTYRPLEAPPPPPLPSPRVALVLSDQGRVGAGPTVGSGIVRVEGSLVDATDTDYTLRVAEVTDIRGAQSRWSGEQVRLQRSYVANAYERRFSKPRTYLLVGALT